MTAALFGGARAIGLGCYRLGAATEEIALAALRLGYRHLDTAALYGNEAAVARAIARSGLPRDAVFVTSKIRRADIAAGRTVAAARESLAQLGRIDLLLLHAPTPNAAAAWADLAALRGAEPIGAIGVSNFERADLDGLPPPRPAANQIEATPFLPRDALRRACAARGIDVAAHSPLTKGRRLGDPVLAEIAGEARATPAQTLLAWSLAKGMAPLPRTTSPDRLAENWAARRVSLTAAQTARLDALADGFATHPKHVR